MSVLVYAFGGGQPISGESFATAEIQRCVRLWDELAELDRQIAAREMAQAEADDAALAALSARLREQTTHLAEHPDDKAVRAARRQGFRQRNQALDAWRKTHREWLRTLDAERMSAVVAIRRHHTIDSDDPIYWGNSNRVLQSYDTGRKVARLKGRLIRLYDAERDDGVLTVQIQRTRTGLGAAPVEIMDRIFAHVQITPPNARRQAELSMRVDAAGNRIVLPIWLHRQFPTRCRIKAAQLTYRRRGARLRWQVCFTLDTSDCTLYAPMRQATAGCAVEFDWCERGYLEVMRTGDRIWRLPQSWMSRMNDLERRQAWLDQALNDALVRWGADPLFGPLLALRCWADRMAQIALARPRLSEEQVQWWVNARRLWLALPGMRARILGSRREVYRLWARELVSTHAALHIDEVDLAQMALEDRGNETNRWRHRAAVHILRLEIVHQAAKAGTPILDASGAQVNAPCAAKSSAWNKKKAAKAQRSQVVDGDRANAGLQ